MTDSLTQLTKELCEIPSVTGDEEAMAAFLEERFKKLPEAFSWKREGQALWVQSPRREGKKFLGFFGHTDTVPVSKDNPVRIEGQVLYGLGSCDMKGGLALMLQILDDAVEALPEKDFLLVFYDKEEGPIVHSGLTPMLEAHPEWKELDLAICLEPTDNAIQLGCVGGLHATLKVEGQAAHSARPWQGKNAVHMAGPLLSDLLARDFVVVDVQGLEFREVMNVTLAEGGSARNVIPGEFVMTLNYRYAPGKDDATARQELLSFIDGRAEVEWQEQIPSGRVCLDNSLLKELLSGRDLKIEAKQAWTDVAQISQFGVDAINCGPGHPKYAHQADEQIRIGALDLGMEIMREFLK
jgi:succinyl-diaminopimelate desuccinylase